MSDVNARLPGYLAFAWLFFMQPVSLHHRLRACGIDDLDTPAWRLWCSQGDNREHQRAYLQRMGVILFVVMPLLTLAIVGGMYITGYEINTVGVAGGRCRGRCRGRCLSRFLISSDSVCSRIDVTELILSDSTVGPLFHAAPCTGFVSRAQLFASSIPRPTYASFSGDGPGAGPSGSRCLCQDPWSKTSWTTCIGAAPGTRTCNLRATPSLRTSRRAARDVVAGVRRRRSLAPRLPRDCSLPRGGELDPVALPGSAVSSAG